MDLVYSELHRIAAREMRREHGEHTLQTTAVVYQPEASAKPDSKRKLTVHLLELASGKDRPWAEHPTDSVYVGGTFGQDSGWLWLSVHPPGPLPLLAGRLYLVPWREAPVRQSEWIKIPLPEGTSGRCPVSPRGNFFYFFEGSMLQAIRFEPQRVASANLTESNWCRARQ